MVRQERAWAAGKRTVVGATALAAAGLVGLASAAFGGCGQAAPIDSAGGESHGAPAVGQTAEDVVSAQVCTTLRRLGASGTVFDAEIASPGAGTNKNFGASPAVFVGPTGGVQFQGLFEFDLGSIPAGPSTNVNSATLSLTQSSAVPTGAETINVHRATVLWSEATVTAQSFAAGFDPTITTTFTNATQTPSINLTALVSSWARGVEPNFGVVLESALNETSYWSSDYATVAQRPSLSVCYTVTCAPGFADCNNNGLDGCEVNTASSPANCGGCGHACVEPNAVPACVNGTCEVGACNLGFGDCNKNPADGCETLLTTNANCGGCGIVCALPGAVASCASGTCTLVACDPGHYDCDGNPADGCEATPCVNGSHCAVDAGCISGICVGGFCAAPSCNDGVKNGSETGVDCGGGVCPPCAAGGGCNVGADCVGGVCQNGACAAASCNDGVKNGSETDVDCGGGVCSPCANGLVCLVGSDCQSDVCTGGICQAPSCNDGIKNGGETAVDCGGGACPPCADGKSCLVGADCVDLVCVGGVCQVPSCHDGVKNGGESDVDCGGPCPPCNVAGDCAVDADCAGGVCVNGVCQAACVPGVVNPAQFGTTTCGVGACQVTVQNCVNGVVQNCVPGAPLPADLCDGLDENCDGVVNGGCACVNGKTESCYTAAPATLGVGLCQSGIQTCAHGQWGACVGEVTPVAEICDGLDNDCDGQVDDGLGQTTCGVGACQVVTPNCMNGAPQVCTPRAAQPEICDGLDNDCNGLVDDGLPAITCGVGACQVTVSSCVNGQANACVPGNPSPEQCNGIDDNCDGQVDEGNPGGGLPCNTGLPGVCAAGTTACTGGHVVCNQNQQPQPETCDGLDNDCDGVIDNGNPGGGAACSTGQLGVCAAGTTVCSGGHLSCGQNVQPSPEVCDGLDNDCDGVIDNGNPGGGGACSTGLLGVCAAGTSACVAGQLACAENVQPSPEVCDGLDNNCNGVVDEGCGCVDGQEQACYTGAAGTKGVGACHGGTQTCVNGIYGACVGEVLPSAEICDGVDNDCNGQVDDGLGTVSCGVGACANSAPACVNGHAGACVPKAPQPETCDGIDNDCDGVIDNGNPGGGAACATGLLGVCSAGTTACIGGALACVENVQASVEVCDGLDNDCDGVIDNGNPGGGAACNTGLLGVCAAGTTTCSGGMLACSENVQPSPEVCGDGLDNNCNGQVDEGCVCSPFSSISCYTGPAGTNGVGLCHSGTETCNAQGTAYGACTGEVVPVPESCHTAGDDNCNGQVNEGCAADSCAFYTETFDPNGFTHPQSTTYYQSSWCNETPSPPANMPSCPGKFSTAGMRTNGPASSPQLWVSRGASSCSGVELTYDWYQFAQSSSSLQYAQSNDAFVNCGENLFFTTLVPASSQSALQTCSVTTNVTVPFGNDSSVYIKFTNSNASNNAMWYDNVVVTLVGCPCN